MKLINVKNLIAWTVLFSSLTVGSVSQAAIAPNEGGHSGNGGVQKEQTMKMLMLELIPYLYSSEGNIAFPEIKIYDGAHPWETIADIIRKTSPVLIKGKQFDIFSAERDCVSYFENARRRYFQCNQNVFPKITFENQPAISSFLLHEILVQARLETPDGPEVPSSYAISSRLEFHQETVTSVKWVPGAQKSVSPERDQIILSLGKGINVDEYFRSETTNKVIVVRTGLACGTWQPQGLNSDWNSAQPKETYHIRQLMAGESAVFMNKLYICGP